MKHVVANGVTGAAIGGGTFAVTWITHANSLIGLLAGLVGLLVVLRTYRNTRLTEKRTELEIEKLQREREREIAHLKEAYEPRN